MTKSRFSFYLLLLAATFCLAARVWAHGDDDHSAEAKPAIAMSGDSQTEITLRLSDLAQSGAGTEALLEGAKIQGVLKNGATGEKIAPVMAEEEGTRGTYKVHFNGEEEALAFPAAGRYELDLHITPKNGAPVDALVPFELPSSATTTAPTPPLWRRALALVAGLGLLGLIASIFKRRGRNSGGGKAVKKTKTVETATAALLMVVLGASLWTALPVRAHGDDDHAAEELPAASVPATQSAIVAGEITTRVDAGATRAAEAPELKPGQVCLPSQTAELLQIETEAVKVAQLATGIAITGQIAPHPEGIVRVASLVPGRVTRLGVKQGDRVTRGQIVALVESRAIGEAQSAYAQAAARLQNARSNLQIVEKQARAGVFSRAPLETARRARAEAAGEVRVQGAALEAARTALDLVSRTARIGGYANPALEAARGQAAQATESLKTAQAALASARASVAGAQAELRRRQQLAASGAYSSRPVEEARRALVAAQSARAAAQSEVATTRANLSRARSLEAEGLVSTRNLETAGQAFETAQARLESAVADERAASGELARGQKIAASDVNERAEISAARGALAQALADARTREAEVARAATGANLASSALRRERAIFGAGLANRRELGEARARVQNASAGLYKARRALESANLTLAREENLFRQNLNNTAQIQAARAGLVSAQADANAARDALKLLQSTPGASVSVPIRAPLAGIVQTREVALGEVVQADAPLLTIVNLQTVALEAALFEADAARVGIGAPVTITTDAARGKTFRGRISFIGANVNPETRAVTARATIPNPGALRLGVFVRGQIQTGQGPLALSIPASAVLDDGAAKIVFVAKNGIYERRAVTLGAQSDGRVELRTGVEQGEIVVTAGASALRAEAARGT